MIISRKLILVSLRSTIEGLPLRWAKAEQNALEDKFQADPLEMRWGSATVIFPSWLLYFISVTTSHLAHSGAVCLAEHIASEWVHLGDYAGNWRWTSIYLGLKIKVSWQEKSVMRIFLELQGRRMCPSKKWLLKHIQQNPGSRRKKDFDQCLVGVGVGVGRRSLKKTCNSDSAAFSHLTVTLRSTRRVHDSGNSECPLSLSS